MSGMKRSTKAVECWFMIRDVVKVMKAWQMANSSSLNENIRGERCALMNAGIYILHSGCSIFAHSMLAGPMLADTALS